MQRPLRSRPPRPTQTLCCRSRSWRATIQPIATRRYSASLKRTNEQRWRRLAPYVFTFVFCWCFQLSKGTKTTKITFAFGECEQIFDEFIKKQQSGGDSSKDTDPLNGDNKETEATTTLAVLPKKASTKTTKTKSTKAAPRTTTEQQSNTSEDEDSDTLDIRLREKNEDDTDDDEDDDDDDDDDSSHVTSDDAEGDDDESQDDASDESDAEDEDEDDDAASVSDKQETTLTVTASSSSVVEHNEVATAAAESTTTHDALTADVVGQVVQECFTDQAPPQAQEAQASLKRCLSVTSTTSTVSQTNHSEVASVVIKKLRLVADIKQQTSSSENESSNRVARSSPRKAKLIPVTAKTITTKTATSKTSVVVDRNKRNESLSDDDDCIIID